MEQLEIDDVNFFPCTCGYQVKGKAFVFLVAFTFCERILVPKRMYSSKWYNPYTCIIYINIKFTGTRCEYLLSTLIVRLLLVEIFESGTQN